MSWSLNAQHRNTRFYKWWSRWQNVLSVVYPCGKVRNLLAFNIAESIHEKLVDGNWIAVPRGTCNVCFLVYRKSWSLPFYLLCIYINPEDMVPQSFVQVIYGCTQFLGVVQVVISNSFKATNNHGFLHILVGQSQMLSNNSYTSMAVVRSVSLCNKLVTFRCGFSLSCGRGEPCLACQYNVRLWVL